MNERYVVRIGPIVIGEGTTPEEAWIDAHAQAAEAAILLPRHTWCDPYDADAYEPRLQGGIVSLRVR